MALGAGAHEDAPGGTGQREDEVPRRKDTLPLREGFLRRLWLADDEKDAALFQQWNGELQSLGMQGTSPRKEGKRVPDADHQGRRTAFCDLRPDGIPGRPGVPGRMVPERGRQGGGWDGGGHGHQGKGRTKRIKEDRGNRLTSCWLIAEIQ